MSKDLKTTVSPSNTTSVPPAMIIAGAWSWRLLAIIGALAAFIYIASLVSEVLIPFAIAILFGALLVPLVNTLKSKGWPHGLAVVTSLLGTVVVVAGLVTLIVTQIHSSLPELQSRGRTAYTSLKNFLASPAIGINQQDIDNGLKSIESYVQEHSSALTAGLTSAGNSLGHVIVGLLLGIFSLIFILIDGKNIWRFFVNLFPRKARPAINGSGDASWSVLKSFVRSQVIVAAVNGLGIGIGAFFIRVPLFIPIGILVFLGSFIPIIGGLLTGLVAVLIALIFNGPIAAIIMLAVLLLVHQLEEHVLQPFLIGKSVHIHPLAIVLSVAIGTILGGIPGALFAVPFVAVLSRSVSYISRRSWEAKLAEPVQEVT